VKTMELVTVPGSRFGGAVKRAGDAAIDLFGIGRRTCDYARPLRSAEPPVSAADRARLIGAAGADEVVITLMRQALTPGGEDAFAAGEAEVPALLEHLEREGALADPASYHEAPHVPDLEWTTRSVLGRTFEQVTFRSPYAPPPSVPGATRYAEQTGNSTAHAWVLRQTSRAPWVVCVHGAGMGDPLVDLMLFRARALHSRGFNVAIAVLPHHGPRGLARFNGSFPSVDVVSNLHGASQAIADVRAVLAYITARGEPAALHGLSLGSYVAAGVAALEPTLSAVVVGVPVVNLARIMRTHTPENRTREPRYVEVFEHAIALEGVTSPIRLGLPATKVRQIYAGRADRFVPTDQVLELVEHWDLDDAAWYTGGHLGFMTTPTSRHCLDDALVEAGLAHRQDDGDMVAVV
jgi:pimeloyl-ACP methyl ester carboxylesterase